MSTFFSFSHVQGRGELRRELARYLRTGRARRRPRGRGENTGPIRDMVMISERSAEAADRYRRGGPPQPGGDHGERLTGIADPG